MFEIIWRILVIDGYVHVGTFQVLIYLNGGQMSFSKMRWSHTSLLLTSASRS